MEPTTALHQRRRRLRTALQAGDRLAGTFVKLATPDVVEVAADAGLDFVVVDLEHSTLSEAEATGLLRHADALGLAALVRLPEVDAPLVARLLENGAAGIQLSTLRTAAQARALRSATRFGPVGERSVSLANRAARFGAVPLADFLALEAADPPLLVGQIETRIAEPLHEVVADLDVAFVGTTDLAVSLGLPAPEALAAAVADVQRAAEQAEVSFGGWAPALSQVGQLGLDRAGYVIVGSDLQLLARALRDIQPKNQED